MTAFLCSSDGVVDPGPAPGHLLGGATRACRDQRRRRGRVPDPHVSGHEQARPPGDGGRATSTPTSRAAPACSVVMARFDGQVAGARCHVPAHEGDRVGGDRGRHADVDDDDIGAGVAGEDVDGRATGAEVRHHLGGHFLGPRRHALGDDTVIAGEHGHGHGLGNRWWTGTGDGAQADADLLDATERPPGLGQAVVVLRRGSGRVGVHGPDGAAGFGKRLSAHDAPFRRACSSPE